MVLDAAQGIVEAEGLRGLSTRRIAREVGYSSGTIYNVFEDLDDLIIQLSNRTLDMLYAEVSVIGTGKRQDARLRELADAYIRFTFDHPLLWDGVFEHRLPAGREMPESYSQRIVRLLDLVAAAFEPYFGPGQEQACMHSARVLWASFYGICQLERIGKRGEKHITLGDMIDILITTHLAGLEALRGKAKRSFSPQSSSG